VLRADVAVLRARLQRRVSVALRSARAAVGVHAAEGLLSGAFLAGWALLTHAVAQLVPARIPTWEISVGVLLLSLCGWKFLGLLCWIGLYKASASKGDG
jgi:hypothetical protein